MQLKKSKFGMFFNSYHAYYLPGKHSTIKATFQLLWNLKKVLLATFNLTT